MTHQIGSFGEALLRAFGALPDSGARLERITDAAIREHAPSLRRAADKVERTIRAEGGMMIELLDQAQFTRALVEKYTARRAHRIKVSLKGNGAGQLMTDNHARGARPDEHSNAAAAAGGGHGGVDAQPRCAPATNTAPGGAAHDRANRRVTPTATLPGHARRTGAAMGGARAATRRALLDTIRVNGQPLRDVTAGEALGYAEKARRDAGLIERICTGLKEKEPVGAQIDDEEAERRANR